LSFTAGDMQRHDNYVFMWFLPYYFNSFVSQKKLWAAVSVASVAAFTKE